MALTQGKHYPVTANTQDSASPAGFTWNNPSNVTATDASVADATFTLYNGSPISDTLVTSGFKFAIPSNATITQIVVVVKCRYTLAAGSLSDTGMQAALATAGTSYPFSTTTGQTTVTTLTDTTLTMTDIALTNITPSVVNASTFGVNLNASFATVGAATATVEIDSVNVAVSFTIPAGDIPTTSATCIGCWLPGIASYSAGSNLVEVVPNNILDGGDLIQTTGASQGVLMAATNTQPARLAMNGRRSVGAGQPLWSGGVSATICWYTWTPPSSVASTNFTCITVRAERQLAPTDASNNSLFGILWEGGAHRLTIGSATASDKGKMHLNNPGAANVVISTMYPPSSISFQAWVGDGTNAVFYVNNRPSVTVGSRNNTGSSSSFKFGWSNIATHMTAGNHYAEMWFSGKLTAAEIASVRAWLESVIGVSLKDTEKAYIIAGDSISSQFLSDNNQGWQNLSRELSTHTFYTYARGSTTIGLAGTGDIDAANETSPIDAILGGTYHTRKEVLCFVGVNNLRKNHSGATPSTDTDATIVSNLTGYLTTYAAARITAGATKVWFETLVDYASGGASDTASFVDDVQGRARRASYNAAIPGLQTSQYKMVDFASISGMGVNGDAAGANFQDALHPNDTGMPKMALKLDYFIGPSSSGGMLTRNRVRSRLDRGRP